MSTFALIGSLLALAVVVGLALFIELIIRHLNEEEHNAYLDDYRELHREEPDCTRCSRRYYPPDIP